MAIARGKRQLDNLPEGKEGLLEVLARGARVEAADVDCIFEARGVRHCGGEGGEMVIEFA